MNVELPEEKIEKEEVRRLLKEKGWDDPETRELFYRWVDQEKEPVKTIEDLLRFEFEQARMLANAKDAPESVEDKIKQILDDAYYLAGSKGLLQLFEELDASIPDKRPNP